MKLKKKLKKLKKKLQKNFKKNSQKTSKNSKKNFKKTPKKLQNNSQKKAALFFCLSSLYAFRYDDSLQGKRDGVKFSDLEHSGYSVNGFT